MRPAPLRSITSFVLLGVLVARGTAGEPPPPLSMATPFNDALRTGEVTPYGSITGRVLDRASGAPLDYANVFLPCTTLDTMARNGGQFAIQPVPTGVYQIRATFVGYESLTLEDFRVEAGKASVIEFRLERGIHSMTSTIRIEGRRVKCSLDRRAGTSRAALEAGADPADPLPPASRLYQNAPNPCNPSTVIRLDLVHTGRVKLEIFDARGSRVRRLLEGDLERNRHAVRWDGRDDSGRPAASGVYFYRLEAPDLTASRRMLLLQ